MKPVNDKNTVAIILQMYAYVNAVGGIILAFVLAGNIEELAFVIAAVALVMSLFIYALGEIIELLNAIKLNTKLTDDTKDTKEEIQELPEI